MTRAAANRVVRRACKVMGWPYSTSHIYKCMRKVGLGEAVAVSLEKLTEMLDRIERAEQQGTANGDPKGDRNASKRVCGRND